VILFLSALVKMMVGWFLMNWFVDLRDNPIYY